MPTALAEDGETEQPVEGFNEIDLGGPGFARGAGIDGLFESRDFRLALETIHNRLHGVRLIGLVFELEFQFRRF